MRDYDLIIDFLENYKNSYQEFLLKLTDDWKNLFTQKYLEIKKINDERNKLEIKNQKNPQILEKLKWEKQENLKSILLLSNANFLMLEKLQLLTEGIKNIAKDTKNQKQTIQQIVKDLEVYQEIYKYQIRATKVRQEIAKIAETAINIENILQHYFSPFQSLIDEVVRLDENFYTTVAEIKNLADSALNYPLTLLKVEEFDTISEKFIDLLVASYEKKDRLKDAFVKSQLLDWQFHSFDCSNDVVFLEKIIYLISDYTSNHIVDQKKLLGIEETNTVSSNSLLSLEKIELVEISDREIPFAKEFKSSKNIEYN